MQILTKVVLGALGYTLIKNKDQVVKELNKAPQKKVAKSVSPKEIIENPTKAGIKADGFGSIESSETVHETVKAPERVITPKKDVDTLDGYVLNEVEKERQKREEPNDLDSYVMECVKEREEAIEREKRIAEANLEREQHLYKSHVSSNPTPRVTEKQKKEIKEKFKTGVNPEDKDGAILSVVLNSYLDYKTQQGYKHSVNEKEITAIKKMIKNRNITVDNFAEIFQNYDETNQQSNFNRVLKERGLGSSDQPLYCSNATWF